jgi:hypothetical protein
MVVRDVLAASNRHCELFGGTFEVLEVTKKAPKLIDHTYEDVRLRVSYGRYAGRTVEFVQTLEGYGHYARWLDEHGESVQHIGYWVPDVLTATRELLSSGCRLTSATMSSDGMTSTEMAMLSTEDVLDRLLPGTVHLETEVSPVEMELLGPDSLDAMKCAFGSRLEELMTLPSWSGSSSSTE